MERETLKNVTKIAQEKGYTTAEELQKAIDKISKYRLIADVTLDEEVTHYIVPRIRQPLSRAEIFIETPAASATEGILVKMSDVYENATVTGGTLIIQLNAISTTARYCTIDIETNEYGAFAKGTQGTSMILQNSISGGYNPNVTAISKLLIRAHTAGNMLPAGTKIKIWGY
ncbi:MAG: hypothetical protein K2L19_10110 [Eubacterium sp.]|nr:hypothetical protein [Eubacterium sp.]